MLTTEDFDFDLPEELIAQTPLKERTSSRLLVMNRQTGELTDKHFYDIIDYLNPGDALVMIIAEYYQLAYMAKRSKLAHT